jgi:hypothetical protein
MRHLPTVNPLAAPLLQHVLLLPVRALRCVDAAGKQEMMAYNKVEMLPAAHYFTAHMQHVTQHVNRPTNPAFVTSNIPANHKQLAAPPRPDPESNTQTTYRQQQAMDTTMTCPQATRMA